MDTSTESAPVTPAENAGAGEWLHYVAPQAEGASTWLVAAKRRLLRAAGECGGWAVVVAVVGTLFAAPLCFLVVGIWSVSTYIGTLLTLWRQVKSYQLANLTPLLDRLDVAARLGLASVGYFALLAALLVLLAGLLGKRWRRLFLVPGIILAVPTALAFFLGFRLSMNVLAAPLHLSLAVQTVLLVYLLCDAVLLAGALVDVSPRRKRTPRSRRALLGRRRGVSAPLAPIHFGPSGRLAAVQTPSAGGPFPAMRAPATPRAAEADASDSGEEASTAAHAQDAGAMAVVQALAIANEADGGEVDTDTDTSAEASAEAGPLVQVS